MKRPLLVFCLVAAGCGNDIAAGIESANDLLYSEQYVESERLYRKLLRRLESEAPNLDEEEEQQRLLVLDRLGKLNALYLHDYDRAIRYYKQLVMQYPRSDQAFAGLATIADILQHKLGKHEAAIEAYQKMVTDFPEATSLDPPEAELRRKEQTRAQLKIANAYFTLKNFEQARTEAEKLIDRWPDSSESDQARFQIANSYYLEGRYAEAVATYERLLEDEVDPELTSLVLFELGNCFQELGENERALAYYYGCLADHPDPLLVQRKIKRLRKRIGRARPADSIHIPGYLKSRLEAVRSLPFRVKTDDEADKKPATSPASAPRPAATTTSTATAEPRDTRPPNPNPEPTPEPAQKAVSKPKPKSKPNPEAEAAPRAAEPTAPGAQPDATKADETSPAEAEPTPPKPAAPTPAEPGPKAKPEAPADEGED